MISSGRATLRELQTFYSVSDLYLILEVIMIDRHNEWLAQEWAKQHADDR